MLLKLVRSIGVRTVEIAISVAVVLGCFVVVLLLLNFVFPTGTNLSTMLGRQHAPTTSASRAAGSTARELLADGIENNDPVATLARTRNEVKAKSAATIAWGKARRGMPLHDRDAVQTLSRSTAQIAFDDENEIDLSENTLVVVRRLDSGLFSGDKRKYQLTVDGELRGRLVADAANAIELEVEMPAGVTRLKTEEGEKSEVEFRIKVNPDKSATVTVDKGHAEVESRGETVVLGAKQFTRVDTVSAPAAPKTLSRGPTLQSPKTGEVFEYRALSPRIGFAWSPADGADGHRLRIATDSDLSRVVYDGILADAEFVHGNLGAGTYHWEVTGMAGNTEISSPSRGRFRVIQDSGAPPLEVDFPATPVQSDHFLLRGRAGSGITVYVKGQQVDTAPDGTFTFDLKLEPGLNSVVVEAVDAVGNVTYKSKIINSKY